MIGETLSVEHMQKDRLAAVSQKTDYLFGSGCDSSSVLPLPAPTVAKDGLTVGPPPKTTQKPNGPELSERLSLTQLLRVLDGFRGRQPIPYRPARPSPNQTAHASDGSSRSLSANSSMD